MKSFRLRCVVTTKPPLGEKPAASRLRAGSGPLIFGRWRPPGSKVPFAADGDGNLALRGPTTY